MKFIHKISFLMITFLLAVTITAQNVIQVEAGIGKIKAAVDGASSGDIIELITDGGIYTETEYITVSVPLTIKAKEGLSEKPTLVCENNSKVIELASSLWLDGFNITGFVDDGVEDAKDSTEYAIRMADVVDSAYVLNVNNVDFDFFYTWDSGDQEFSGYVFRADEGAVYAGEISFTNCMFSRVPLYAFRLREPSIAPAQFGLLNFENCTFAEIGEYAVRAAMMPQDGVTPASVVINHCTFYDIGKDAIRMDDGTDINVKNSIFFDTGDVVDAPNATVTFCDTIKVDGFNIDDASAIISDIFGDDPEFEDIDNLNLTVSEAFAESVLGDDGATVGDRRWVPEHQPVKIEVAAGSNAISTALNSAGIGDTLVLITDGGVYSETDSLVINKSIVLMADASLSNKPSIETENALTVVSIEPGNSFTVKGILFDGSKGGAQTTYGIMAVAGADYNLYVDNCEFYNFANAIFGKESLADEVVIENCLMSLITDEKVINFSSSGTVNNFTLKNSTIWNTNDYAVYVKAPGNSLVIDHVTIYTEGQGAEKIIYPKYAHNAIIKNSILASAGQSADLPLAIRLYNTDSFAEYILTWQTAGIELKDDATLDSSKIIFEQDPLFIDAANGNFDLSEDSPAIGFAEDGGNLGDPRWKVIETSIKVEAGTGTLSAAIASAPEGSIIKLVTDGGVYVETDSLIIDKEISIISAPGLSARPSIQINAATTGIRIENGAKLYLEGLLFDGSTGTVTPENLFFVAAAAVYDLSVEDCEFYNFGRLIFAAEGKGNMVSLNNCLIAHMPEEKVMDYSDAGSVAYFSLTNSTLWDINDYGVYVKSDSSFCVNHITVYSKGDGAEKLIYPKYAHNAVVKNSILATAGASSDVPLAVRLYNPDSRAEYLLTWNTDGIGLKDDATIDSSKIIFEQNPLFVDAENGNFDLHEGSPAIGFAEDGSNLGDPRWSVIVGVDEETNGIPNEYTLSQNYPNPFNPSTVISFSIPKAGLVSVKVFNILGQEVANLVNEVKAAGNYSINFDASNLPSGIYIYTLNSNNFSSSKKMMLLK